MSTLKTVKNDASVVAFLGQIEDEQTRKDAFSVLELMKKITASEPAMWGDSIVGFGDYHYKYASGREGDWFLTGFSPRKQNLTIYLMSGIGNYEKQLSKLGKYKTSKSCLYIKRMADIDVKALEEIIQSSVNWLKEKY